MILGHLSLWPLVQGIDCIVSVVSMYIYGMVNDCMIFGIGYCSCFLIVPFRNRYGMVRCQLDHFKAPDLASFIATLILAACPTHQVPASLHA